jgi:hypothetical protein
MKDILFWKKRSTNGNEILECKKHLSYTAKFYIFKENVQKGLLYKLYIIVYFSAVCQEKIS